MKPHRFSKVVSLLTALLMLFALCAVPAMAADEAGETTEPRSLTDYVETENIMGWWGVENAINSVWVKSNDKNAGYVWQYTDGYYEGWDTTNQSTTGTHHPKGIGMHSAKAAKPSVIYNIEDLKVTGLKTTVFLVQYDGGTDAFDVDTTSEGAAHTASTMKVYFATSPDGETETYTNIVEMDLTGKGASIEVELTADDLAGAKYLKFGLSNLNENTTSDPSASVYFADLTITQSEDVPVPEVYLPPIPMRPTQAPTQTGAYEAIDLPMISDKNFDGKPYGTWKAGENPLYYLSDLIPDGIPAMNGKVELPADSKYLTSSNTTNDTWKDGQPTTKDYPYGSSSGVHFTFGAPQFEYTKGIGMHPKNPNQPYEGRTDSWTLFDISEYTKEDSETPANTFYALIGLTAAANDWGSLLSCQGLYVYIYGDKTGDGENFEFLAASEQIISYQLGEFNVDVTGVKTLLIQVILQEEASSHGYSAVGFGDACLFMADENATKPDYTRTVDPGKKDDGSDTSKPEDKPEAPTDTNGPADTNGTNETDTAPDNKKQSGGCASGVGLTEVALFVPALAGVVFFRKRRKHE